MNITSFSMLRQWLVDNFSSGEDSDGLPVGLQKSAFAYSLRVLEQGFVLSPEDQVELFRFNRVMGFVPRVSRKERDGTLL